MHISGNSRRIFSSTHSTEKSRSRILRTATQHSSTDSPMYLGLATTISPYTVFFSLPPRYRCIRPPPPDTTILDLQCSVFSFIKRSTLGAWRSYVTRKKKSDLHTRTRTSARKVHVWCISSINFTSQKPRFFSSFNRQLLYSGSGTVRNLGALNRRPSLVKFKQHVFFIRENPTLILLWLPEFLLESLVVPTRSIGQASNFTVYC